MLPERNMTHRAIPKAVAMTLDEVRVARRISMPLVILPKPFWMLGRLSLPSDLDVTEAQTITLLELSDVWKSYDGSGKTTLLFISGCLDSPSKGRVLIGGREVGGMKEKELSEVRLRKIGFVFQDHNLIEELTVLQNVMLPLRLAKAEKREERAGGILEVFGLSPLSSRRPMEISTGQRQLVAVARALANGPPMLLADEPTASLDEENAALVLDALRRANADMGTAIVLTRHHTAPALDGSKRFELRDGRLFSR
jgi:ABC-type lipoprotein export system ATPase subunit